MSIYLGTVTTPAEAAAALQGAVEAFLRAGGVFRWSDWADMSTHTRLAAEAAGAALSRERARFEAEESAALQIERERSSVAEQILDEVIEQGVLA